MRSSNPVFSRRGFSRDNGTAGFNGQQPQAGGPAVGTNPYATGNPYAEGATNPYATNPYAPQDTQLGAPQQARGNVMTIDDVVSRTAMTLGTVVLTAVLSWLLLPVDPANLGKSYGIAIGAALVALVLSLVQSFKRKPSCGAHPGLRGLRGRLPRSDLGRRLDVHRRRRGHPGGSGHDGGLRRLS